MNFKPMMWRKPDAGDGGGNSTDKGGDNGNAGKTFTQQELDAIVGERATRAGDAAVKKLLESLGVENAEALKTFVTESKKLQEERLTEAEKQKKAVADAEKKVAEAGAKAQTALETANTRLMKAAVLAEASKADYKISPSALQDVWLFVEKEQKATLKLTEDGEVEGVAEALKAVLKNRQHLIQPTKKPDLDGDKGKNAQAEDEAIKRRFGIG